MAVGGRKKNCKENQKFFLLLPGRHVPREDETRTNARPAFPLRIYPSGRKSEACKPKLSIMTTTSTTHALAFLGVLLGMGRYTV